MKITLVQAEIHEAIEAYIRSQITVNEGMKIEINLRATRGEEGTTAEIDIFPVEEEPEVQVETSVAGTAVARKPRGPNKPKPSPEQEAPVVTQNKPVLEPVTHSETETAPATNEAVADVPVSDDPEPGSEAALAAEAARTEPVADPEAAPEAPKRQSLFGGLNKANTKND